MGLELAGGRRIEEKDSRGVAAQCGCRAGFRDGSVKSRMNGRAFVGPVDEDQRARHAEKERHGERESARGDIFQAGEGAVVNLLHTADIVEFDRADVARVLEIADRRIDEGEVAVLADTHDHQARARLPQQGGVALAFGIGIGGLGVELVEGGDRDVVEEAIAEKAAEGCRMVSGHTGVLVHVKRGEARPVYGLIAKSGEEGVLRHGGREDDGGLAFARDGLGNDRRGDLRAGGPGFIAVGVDAHFQLVTGRSHVR